MKKNIIYEMFGGLFTKVIKLVKNEEVRVYCADLALKGLE